MNILNLGSLNIDHVYTLPHFVRPGETLSSSRYLMFAGGKGLNQSIALAKAGVKVFHGGKIGHDGLFLKTYIENFGVDTSNIILSKNANGHAVIQVDGQGQNCIILYGGTNKEITPQDVDIILDQFLEGDIVLLQNEISSLEYIFKKAAEKKLRVAFNPSPVSDDLKECDFTSVSWFLLNEIEGAALSGQNDPEKITIELLRRYPGASIVLTLGSHGVLFANYRGILHHDIYKVPVVDTTAAGDTFTGYFLAGVLNGLSTEKCLQRASIASALAVGRNGASNSIPDKKEVDQKELEWTK